MLIPVNCTPIIDLTIQAWEHHRTNTLTRQTAIHLIDAWTQFARAIGEIIRNENTAHTFDPWRTGEAIHPYIETANVIVNTLVPNLQIPESDDEYYQALTTMEKVHEYLAQFPITNHAQIRRIRAEYAAGNYTTFYNSDHPTSKISRVDPILL